MSAVLATVGAFLIVVVAWNAWEIRKQRMAQIELRTVFENIQRTASGLRSDLERGRRP
jgi:hypothetical protein